MYNREKIINTMYDIYDESKSIKPYVLVGQPRRDKAEMPAQNFDGYDNLHIDFNGFSHGFVDIGGEKVDVARNYIIEQAIASGAKYLLFIGEDTVVPYDGFKTLHETAEKNPDAVIVGVYYIKISGAMIMVRNNDWITIPNVDPGQIIEAWQTGMDIMLVPISVLKKMKEEEPEMPFCCIGNGIGDLPFIGEDNFFVHRLRRHGIKLLVDTNVQCLHMDLASGKFTAHPDVDLKNYYTQIPITERLTLEDKFYIDKRWVDRLPKGSGEIDKVTAAINAGETIKLNMGCGEDKLEGYFGVDKHHPSADIKQDLTELNLPAECADEILASHIIEHIPQHRTIETITKWFNLLKTGGKLVMELPDMEKLCAAYVEADDQKRYELSLWIFGAAVNYIDDDVLKNGTPSPHLWGFTPKQMVEILENVGFESIEVLPQQGQHPGFNFRIEATK